MRRILAAAVLAAALFTATACSGDPVRPDAGSVPSAGASTDVSPGAGVAPSTSGAVTGSTDPKATCAAVIAESKKFVSKLVTRAQELGESLSDPDKVKVFFDELTKDYVGLSTTVKAEAAKTSDPKLRKALEDVAKALDASVAQLGDPQKLAEDPSKMQQILFSPELTKANEALNDICPAA
ncbi:hypothetical protein [Catellatospora vulcania]|uniref:hypothetical protein n=1 Tax=Catellatospora vulcania TaxID=1460450 RepID=UPI0012D4893C|nr:hypothetical protein [Catellatospora vulcania]